MIVDPREHPQGEVYRLMIGVIVPRPIAFITTLDAAGRRNAAPFSFFTGVASAPPLLGVSILTRPDDPKDTLRNIRDTGEFVVNVVTEAMARQVVECSGDWPPDVDELELTGLETLPSAVVRPPRVAASPVHLECRLYRELPLGSTTFVVGEIVMLHVADEVLVNGAVDPAKLRPLARLGGDAYTVLGERLSLPRPRVKRNP